MPLCQTTSNLRVGEISSPTFDVSSVKDFTKSIANKPKRHNIYLVLSLQNELSKTILCPLPMPTLYNAVSERLSRSIKLLQRILPTLYEYSRNFLREIFLYFFIVNSKLFIILHAKGYQEVSAEALLYLINNKRSVMSFSNKSNIKEFSLLQ